MTPMGASCPIGLPWPDFEGSVLTGMRSSGLTAISSCPSAWWARVQSLCSWIECVWELRPSPLEFVFAILLVSFTAALALPTSLQRRTALPAALVLAANRDTVKRAAHGGTGLGRVGFASEAPTEGALP